MTLFSGNSPRRRVQERQQKDRLEDTRSSSSVSSSHNHSYTPLENRNSNDVNNSNTNTNTQRIGFSPPISHFGTSVVHICAKWIKLAEFEIFLFIALVLCFLMLRFYDGTFEREGGSSYKRIFSKESHKHL